MSRCFVIQPFDKGRYDKRYEDVFAPAIRDAGLEPYRVDRDPGVSIPIDEIQRGIEASEACVVEISTDNPNVWFELGYAIASHRETVLVCSDERATHFPFDVQHRSVVKYSTESSRDFEQARSQITAKLKAVLEKRTQLGELGKVASVSRLEGLEQYEIAALVAVAQQISEPEGGIPTCRIREDMEGAGFTKLAATLGLKALLDRGMLERFQDTDEDGHPFTAYRVAPKGMSWLFANKDKLALKRDASRARSDDNAMPF
jgi:hypothetical protein